MEVQKHCVKLPPVPPTRARRSQPPPHQPSQRHWLPIALILGAIAMTFANGLRGPFFLDDLLTVQGNPSIRDLGNLRSVLLPPRELAVSGRPVVNLTFALNYALGGLDVRGYHVLNIVIHAFTALLLYGVVRHTLSRMTTPAGWRERAHLVAGMIALAWAVHPLNTEAINYVTQRTELLMGLFFLLTLYAAIRALDETRRALWVATSVLASALGMACKETMVVAPLIVVLYDALLVYGSLTRALRQRAVLYVGLALGWTVLAALLATSPRPHSAGLTSGIDSWTYLLNQAPLILRYLGLTVWPHALVSNYGWPRSLTLVDVWPSMLVMAGLLVATICGLRYRPRAFFPLLWFFVTLAPASSVVPIATEVGAERRMYLPLMGLVVAATLAAAAGWDAWQRRWPAVAESRWPARALTFACASILLALSATTIARNRDYQAPVRLAQLTTDRYPTPVGLHQLGVELIATGRRAEGLQRLKEATAGAPRAHYSLGYELFNEGQLDAARSELERFVERQPMLLEVISARLMLGQIAGRQGRWEDAA